MVAVILGSSGKQRCFVVALLSVCKRSFIHAYAHLSLPPTQIAEAANLEDDGVRQLAAEFLVTLCEAREKAPGMMRKLPAFVERLFRCLVAFLLDIEVGGCV